MTEEKHKPSAAGPQPRKRWKKWIFLLPVPAVLLIGAFLILGMPRRWQVEPKISRTEAAHMQRIIGKLTSAMVTEDGKIAESAVIELTPAEINTLLTNGLRAAQLRPTPHLYYDAEWKEGFLRLRVCRTLPLFAVNLETELVPDIRDGKAELIPRSCRIGWIPLSRNIVGEALRQMIATQEDKPEFRTVLTIVESLTVQENSIRLRFRPQKINLIFPLLLGTMRER